MSDQVRSLETCGQRRGVVVGGSGFKMSTNQQLFAIKNDEILPVDVKLYVKRILLFSEIVFWHIVD